MRRVRGQLDKFGFELLPPRDCESLLLLLLLSPPPSRPFDLDVGHLAAPGGGGAGRFIPGRRRRALKVESRADRARDRAALFPPPPPPPPRPSRIIARQRCAIERFAENSRVAARQLDPREGQNAFHREWIAGGEGGRKGQRGERSGRLFITRGNPLCFPPAPRDSRKGEHRECCKKEKNYRERERERE